MNSLGRKQSSIEDLLKILKYVVDSQSHARTHQGRFYLVIDTKKEAIGVTSDKQLASSTKKVTGFIQKLITEVSNKDVVRFRYLVRISRLFSSILHSSTPYISKIQQKMEATKQQLAAKINVSFHSSVKENFKDYGKEQKPSKTQTTEDGDPLIIERSLTLEGYQRKQAKERGNQQDSQFDKLIEMDLLTPEQVKQAFRIDLERELSAPMPLQHLIGSFDTILDHYLDEIQEGQFTANDIYTRFRSLLKEYIVDTNTETINLDRELFRDIMGKRVKDGAQAKGPPSSFPFDMEEVEKLIGEYHEGSWQDMKNDQGEVINPKELTYQNIRTVSQDGICEMDQVELSLDKVLKHPSFEEVLQKIFNQMEGSSRTTATKSSSLTERSEPVQSDTKELMTIIPDF